MDDGVTTKVSPRRPTITVPRRSLSESFFSGGSFPGFSPGPMTLVSSFLFEQDTCSFSQLIGGAITPPVTKPEDFSTSASSGSDGGNSGGNGGGNVSASVGGCGGNEGGEVEVSGLKQNRLVGLVVEEAPLFMVTPGLSPPGLLNSPLQPHMQLQANFQQSLAVAPTGALQDQSCPLADENLLQDSVGKVPQPQTVRVKSPGNCHSGRKSVVPTLQRSEYDGYNWRKYGQKQVKASEYPRSYYKCTHVGCSVKKKVERSCDGHSTEITYKGLHNHEHILHKKCLKDGSGSIQTSNSHVKRRGSQDQTSSITYPPSLSAPEDGQLSSQPSSQEIVRREHDGLQNNSASVNEDEGNDQRNAKRRCMVEAGVAGHTSIYKTVTESRIIVQTRSAVDLLDDGYKWRKYGQKAVKGNPYPRSYYRCTYVECNVRKQVERAPIDPKNVITTYEGKHNHVMPPAKYIGSNALRSNNFAPLKSQPMNAGKPTLQTGMDFESKEKIPILPRGKEEEIAA